MIHKLKIWPEFFEAVLRDQKRVEIRKDDRGFKVGYYLLLQEWDPEEGYTGREVVRCITHIVKGFEGLQPGYVVLSLTDPKWFKSAKDPRDSTDEEIGLMLASPVPGGMILPGVSLWALLLLTVSGYNGGESMIANL